jgi:hypothetical protein
LSQTRDKTWDSHCLAGIGQPQTFCANAGVIVEPLLAFDPLR